MKIFSEKKEKYDFKLKKRKKKRSALEEGLKLIFLLSSLDFYERVHSIIEQYIEKQYMSKKNKWTFFAISNIISVQPQFQPSAALDSYIFPFRSAAGMALSGHKHLQREMSSWV